MGEEVEMLVDVAEHFPAKINSTSSTVAVRCIKEKLTEAQLSIFRTTCFGKLIEMKDLKFSGKLVHNLLLRQIQSPVKSEMWFAVGGKTLRFSIQEFCLITGLECGLEPPVVSKEKGDGCGSFRSSMLNGEVRFNNKTLEAMFKAASSDNDEDMVKLALLYFLETVLLGKDQKVHIGAQHVELLEDLETFNKFPWGQKCYERTLNSLQRDLRKMSQSYHTTSSEIVSRKKRKRQADNEKDCIKQYPLYGFPYAFQIWACEAIPTVGVAIAIKSGSLLPRIVNWSTPGTPDATYVMKLLDQKNAQVLKKLQPTSRESGEEYVKFLLLEQPPPIPPKRRPRKAAVLKSPFLETEVRKPKKLVKFKPAPKLSQSDLNKFMSWLDEDDSADVRKNIVKLPLCEASRAWFKTLYTPDEWLNDEHIDSAFHWIRQVKSDSPTTKMEICTTTEVLFQQMLDARFQRYTNGEDLWCENDRLFDYAKGLSPKLGTPWIETDKVYIPLNYMSKHWILAEIVFSARKIIVYDSEVNFIGSGKKLKKFMEPLSTLLPLLLHAIDFFSKRPEIHHREDMSPWLVEQCEYVPQQEKSDCGVFVIKFAEHLIHGQSIDSVQVKQAQYFRQQLCLILWRSRLIE